MKPVAIESRLIQSVYFSPEDGRLHLRLTNGRTRVFTGVSEEAVTSLVTAPSPGQYYIDCIRPAFRRVA